MKILLVNDTTNNSHYGCYAVCNALRRFFWQRNIEVFAVFNREWRATLRKGLDAFDALVTQFLKCSDLVVINGEGTLHSGRAPEIERILDLAIERRTPFAVVNAMYSQYACLARKLASAEFVTIRDSHSLSLLARDGVDAIPCADAALFAKFDDECFVHRAGVCASDWHAEAPLFSMHTILESLENGAEFLPFISAEAWMTWPQIVNRIGAFDSFITGRYHAALFRLLAGKPATLLPSNSGKINSLVTDLRITPQKLAEGTLFISLEQAQSARDQLLFQRSNSMAHPLSPLSRRVSHTQHRSNWHHAIDPESDITLARRLADLARNTASVDGDSLAPAFGQAGGDNAKVARIASEFLLQEDQASLALTLAQGLASKSPTEALSIALRALPRPALSPEQSLHAAEVARIAGCSTVATALYHVAEKGIPSLSARFLRRAARVRWLSRDKEGRYNLLRRADEASPSAGMEIVELASAAAVAGDTDVAHASALRAIADESSLTLRGRYLAGEILAALGDWASGMPIITKALKEEDKALSLLKSNELSTPDKRTLYVPPSMGVGMLALTSAVAGIEMLRGNQVTVIADKRIHPPLKRVYPSGLKCVGLRYLDHEKSFANVWSLPEALGKFDWNALSEMEQPWLVADPTTRDQITRRYRSLFKGRPLIGVAWTTSNRRSAEFRNLSLADMLHICSSVKDAVFVSLQADVFAAQRDALNIGATNLYVDPVVDPINSLDNQLAQIAALDFVVSIDCSAIHFAGGLGVKGVCIMSREPCWIWSKKQSLYASIELVSTLPDAISRALMRCDYLSAVS